MYREILNPSTKQNSGQNTIASQMIENDTQNIICNKCHNVICRESLVMCLICTKTVEKMCTLKFDINTYSSLAKQHTRNGKIIENKLLHMQKLHVELQQKMTCVCCNRHIAETCM